mgnify:FL=1
MMKRIVVALTWLALVGMGASPVVGQQPATSFVTMPVQKVAVKSGTLAVLISKAVTEVSFDWDERIVSDGQVYEDTAKKTLVLTSPMASTYRVTATWFELTKGKFKEVWYITFEGGHAPPDPPAPDSFLAKLTTAYKADLQAGKLKVDELKVAQQIVAHGHVLLNSTHNTTVLYSLMDFALDNAVTKGDMPTVLPLIKDRVKETAAVNEPLTEVLKDKFRLMLTEVAKAIESLLGPQPPPDDDPLTKSLRAALVKETVGQSVHLPALEAAALGMISVSASPTMKTTKEVRDGWADRVSKTVAPNLPWVRGVLVRYMDSNLPTRDELLTLAMREQYRKVFTHIVNSLRAVRP